MKQFLRMLYTKQDWTSTYTVLNIYIRITTMENTKLILKITWVKWKDYGILTTLQIVKYSNSLIHENRMLRLMKLLL